MVFKVVDEGIGIPLEDQKHLFSPFYRASNAGEVRGAGLGLSLVHHFAKSHGGDITAHAREGGGTVFRITLPKATAPAATARSSAESPRTEGSPIQRT